MLSRDAAIANHLAWVFAIVFLILLIFVVLYGSRIVLPVTELTSALAYFGKVGEAKTLVGSRTSGEVGDAVDAFNQMVVDRFEHENELRDHRSQLQSLARELARLERRTRQEIAEELHDNISQNLAATKLRLEMLRRRQTSEAHEESLQIAIELLGDSIQSTSNLTRRLAQPTLQQLGLVNALEALVAEYDGRHAVEFTIEDDGEPKPVADEVADTVYRGVKELLHNVIKHANAKSARVEIKRVDETLFLRVEDDGVGLDATPPPMVGRVGGFGLFNLRERVSPLRWRSTNHEWNVGGMRRYGRLAAG